MTNRLRERRQGERGFTLIELLIVIVILGILAAVVVFSVGGITDRGSNSACQANVETVNIASESFRTQNTGYAPTLPALQTAGFLKTIPGTVAGDGLSFAVSNPGGTDYTVSYDPVTGLATSTCPAGSSGSTGSTGSTGGGGGPTTTTLGPCAFANFAPTTVDVDNNGALTQSYTFTVNLTGNCTALTGATVSIDRNGSGGGFGGNDGPRTLTAVGGSNNNQWTIAMSQWPTDWDSNDSGNEGTPGTVAVQITFAGTGAPSTVNSNLTLTNTTAPCVFSSFTPTSVNVNGGTGTISATNIVVNLTGNCAGVTSVTAFVDRDDDGGAYESGESHTTAVVGGSGNLQWSGALPTTGWNDNETVNVRFTYVGTGAPSTTNTSMVTQ